jgi:glycosyltransferase involved in cell wall biosynthesis
MSVRPLVSVVIPVYNHERFVAEAIRSVFAQTWRPLELIIIDDGSRDRSAGVVREVLEKCPSDVTVSFRSRENRGAHVTLNEGLQEARGTWLTILNSDDAYDPARIERCITALEAQRGRLLITYVEPVDDQGVSLPVGHPWRYWYGNVVIQELDVAPSLSALLLRFNIGVSTGNFFFHRSLFEQLGGFADYRYAHDVDFLLRASLTDEPILIREPLYRYRLHGTNTISESERATQRESSKLTAQYLRCTLTGQVTNPFAPRLDSWPHSFASLGMPPHLADALDRLIEQTESALDDVPVEAAVVGDTTGPDLASTLPDLPRTAPQVTLISHDLSHTGAPVLLRDVARALRGAGVEGRVISLESGPLAEAFEAEGCPVVQEVYSSRLLFRIARRLAGLAEHLWVARRSVDRLAWLVRILASRLRYRGYVSDGAGVLLINSFASWPIALPILKRWRGQAFWYIHETFEPAMLMRDEPSYTRLQALRDRGAVRMLYGSDATRAVWARAGFDGDVVYWSGVSREASSTPAPILESPPASPSSDSPSPRRVVLSVQSVGTRKGTRELLEAFAYGRREGLIPEDVELRIVGCHKPSLNPFVRDLLIRIHQPDLHGAVRLVGTVPPTELNVHYQAAEIYVQSSIMECLPLALLTALSHGLPIVSTDADGCREAIEHDNTGLLVPQRQTVLMAEAISRLLNDRVQARAFGQAARRRFEERFSLEATVPVLFETLFGSQLAPVAAKTVTDMAAPGPS